MWNPADALGVGAERAGGIVVGRSVGVKVGEPPVGSKVGSDEGPHDPEGAIVGALGELEGGEVDGDPDGATEGMLVVSERHLSVDSYSLHTGVNASSCVASSKLERKPQVAPLDVNP